MAETTCVVTDGAPLVKLGRMRRRYEPASNVRRISARAIDTGDLVVDEATSPKVAASSQRLESYVESCVRIARIFVARRSPPSESRRGTAELHWVAAEGCDRNVSATSSRFQQFD